MSETDSPRALPAKTTPTWEVELLISGVAVFAMLQLPGLLDDWLLALEPRVGGDWRMVLILAYIYAKSAVVVLAATFVLHLLLRAIWIALVGLHSVYPQGVRFDKLKMGPIQSEVIRGQPHDLPSAIERADNRASVVFAIGVMVAVLFATICVLFPGILLLMNAAGSLVGIRVDPLIVFAGVGALVLLPIVLAALVDQRMGARLRPAGLPYRCVHGVLRVVTRLGLGQGNNLMLSVLASNDGPKRMQAILFAIMMLATGSVGAGYVALNKPELFGNYALFPKAKWSRIDPGHYDDQRDPSRAGTSPYIQAMVVGDPYLKLVVPYDPLRVEPAMRRCRAPEKQAPDARAAALLACLQALHGVSLDGKPLATLRYEIASDPRTERPALLAMIDIGDLPRGRHELRVSRPLRADKKPDKRDPDPGFERIAFWR